VEDDEREVLVRHQIARLAPGALGGRDVALEVLRLPGEALAHAVPFDLVAEARERIALGRMPGALDELHHADPVPAPEHAQREPERRRRLALAGPGVDHQQALFDRLAGHLGVLHGLALLHLGAMARRGGIIGRLAHESPHLVGWATARSRTRSAWAKSPGRLPTRMRIAKRFCPPYTSSLY